MHFYKLHKHDQLIFKCFALTIKKILYAFFVTELSEWIMVYREIQGCRW